MCGIGGFVDYEHDARRYAAAAGRMQRSLTPRGPDAAGDYQDTDAVLVHRRLIVIDPDGGSQPMHAPDGNTVLVYNGELYNTEEIRRDLLSRGHTFRGHSDTEVLLHAFLEWDTDAFERLNGIFAFAIWQKKERRLVLCRDRLGVKPLFVARLQGGIVFGSTIGAVLCHPAVEPEVDEDGLRAVLLLGPARPPASGVFRQIDSLLPGHYAVLTPEGYADRTYWKLEAHAHPDDLQTTIARTHELICDAAQRQLVSDVPLACFLSGGLDSSILSMLAAKTYAARGETLLLQFGLVEVDVGVRHRVEPGEVLRIGAQVVFIDEEGPGRVVPDLLLNLVVDRLLLGLVRRGERLHQAVVDGLAGVVGGVAALGRPGFGGEKRTDRPVELARRA